MSSVTFMFSHDQHDVDVFSNIHVIVQTRMQVTCRITPHDLRDHKLHLLKVPLLTIILSISQYDLIQGLNHSLWLCCTP